MSGSIDRPNGAKRWRLRWRVGGKQETVGWFATEAEAEVARAAHSLASAEMDSEYENPTGYVYFVQAEYGGNIKIGWAHDPERRRRELQCGSPVALKILATQVGRMSVESQLHRRFEHLWVHGEWHRPEADLLYFIASIGGET